MVLHVCVCACVGLEYKMQSAAQFQQVEDIFIMTTISFSHFAVADAALLPLRRCCCCCFFLFVFMKPLALRIFAFYFVFRKKKHPVVF